MVMPELGEEGGESVGEGADSEDSHSVSEQSADAVKEDSMRIGEADLGLDDDGLVSSFDGVEEEEDSGREESSSSSSSSRSGADVSVETAIEEGLAELAAVGLEGSERKRVSGEMEKVASKFKVGYFGNRVAQKYLKRDLDDIPPEYGLAAALIAFAALAIKTRPDGEEKVKRAIRVIKDRTGGGGASPEPEPPRYAGYESGQRSAAQDAPTRESFARDLYSESGEQEEEAEEEAEEEEAEKSDQSESEPAATPEVVSSGDDESVENAMEIENE